MTKRDFEVVAGAIDKHNLDYVLDPLAVSMANAFALRFNAFDKQRFLKACGCSAITLLAQKD